jgi:hypothetical protein
MSSYHHTKASEFRVGMRVELHPAHDAWMAGDRYATVERVGKSIVWVRSDKSNRLRWMHAESLSIMED